jgi:phosphoribosylanthranilate isomerase
VSGDAAIPSASGPPAPHRTLVKVCGLTRLEDARVALDAGADWLGFVLKGASPRRIDAALAGEIVAACGIPVAVAVMVTPWPDEALRLARQAGATRVQLHRVDPLEWPADFPLPVTFAVPVEPDGRVARALPDPRHLVLLDTSHPTLAGGTGASYPWHEAAALARTRDVMLAGGLGPDNAADAVTRVRPFGVDASSRLESAPGIKDHERVRRFVAAVRETDERFAQRP